MADRQPGTALRPQRPDAGAPAPLPPNAGATLMRKIHERVPNSTQVLGFLTLVVSGTILLLLTGLTLTATVVGLIFSTLRLWCQKMGFKPLSSLQSPASHIDTSFRNQKLHTSGLLSPPSSPQNSCYIPFTSA